MHCLLWTIMADFFRPDAGIRTAEGTVAGPKAASLELKRQRDQEAFEERKQKLQTIQTSASAGALGAKFAGAMSHHAESHFAAQTVGLVSAEQFRKWEELKGLEEVSAADDDKDKNQKEADRWDAEEKQRIKSAKKKRKQQQKMLSTLSFGGEVEILDDDCDINNNNTAASSSARTTTSALISKKKDPSIDTSFLPDQHRDSQLAAERERLLVEWKIQQQAAKQQQLLITYSYWDGSGHRRDICVRQGDSIGTFLAAVLRDLAKDFRECAALTADAVLYVKEDLIIPQDLTFYDLIATKARGKSGPLFHFDVHDDIRVGAVDTRIEKDESHPGKVVERKWYERNKHIFPASEWCSEYYFQDLS
jgi:protein FAM50